MTSGLYTGGTYGFLTPIGGVGGGFYVDTNGITVTVHLIHRAFLCRRPAAWPASSISRSRIARRPVIGRHSRVPLG